MIIVLRRIFIVASCLAGYPLFAQGTKPMPRCSNVADFVALGGRDTIYVSSVALTDSTFTSTTRGLPEGTLVRHSGRLAEGEARTMHVEIWPHIADSAGPPDQIADVTIQGADVFARVAAPTRGVQMQHDRLPAGGVLYMTAVPVFLEFLQRQVHAPVGATTTVPVLWLFTGGAVDTVRVERTAADSLTLRFPDTDYSLALAPDRSILAAMIRPKNPTESSYRIVRRDCR